MITFPDGVMFDRDTVRLVVLNMPGGSDTFKSLGKGEDNYQRVFHGQTVLSP